MAQSRVIHYLNQFFAGIGGEDKADMPLDFREGPLGPGKRLQSLLGDSAKIVATAYCGDNYFVENTDRVLEAIRRMAKDIGCGEGQLLIIRPGARPISPWSEVTLDRWTEITEGVDWFGGMGVSCTEY